MPKTLALDSLDLSAIIRPDDTVMWGQAGAEPVPLTAALMAQRHAIGAFGVFLGVPATDTVRPEHADIVRFSAYCGSGANRSLAKAGKLDILTSHYSQLPAMIRSGALKIDVLMLQLAPADQNGVYSLGVAHEYLIAALDSARVVIAEINDQTPWTHGDRMVVDADLDFVVPTSRSVAEMASPVAGETERMIAAHAAGLIEDGATLQFGLGAIPEAILSALSGHRDLGVHSGTIGDGAARLMEAGVITNARKSIDLGATVTGVMMGTRRLYDFADRNPAVQFRSTDYTHNPDVLARIDRFVALNSAIEVDLTGQINAETAGGVYVGAVGGALDFLRAARRSKGGLPIVALPSTAGKASRIVAGLSGPVSTPRSDAGIIITEHGVADLRGLTLSQRIARMIDIAHPNFRDRLDREAGRPG
jgi:acetyl-CoA hydrolase